ncbi:glycosyltransferase family 4 protein [Nocardioides hungaricus]
MRILTVIAEMGSGGAETVVADLATGLADQGHRVTVASSGGWRAEELAARGIGTLGVPLRSRGPAALARSAAALRGTAPDLVHAHNVRAALAAHLGTRTLRRRRPPLVTTVHGLSDADYPRAARLLATSDVVAAVSHDVAERLVGGGLDRGRLRVVENAVPPPEPTGRARARRLLGVAADLPLALCVARLTEPKRVDLLLRAWPDVPGALLVVVGDGEQRTRLERLAAERVRFVGERRDVRRLLGAADVLVLPSDREGLPMSVLEAMAAGVPVVASAVGGLRALGPDVVELVAPGDARALAAGVRRVLADPDRAAALRDRGRAAVLRRFSSSRMRSAYGCLYEEVLGQTASVTKT